MGITPCCSANVFMILFRHCLDVTFLFLVERQDERITEMKREYHSLHERHSEVGDKYCSLCLTRVILRDLLYMYVYLLILTNIF